MKKRTREITALLNITVWCMTIWSCTNRTILHEYHDVDFCNWAEEDTVIFQLPKIIYSGTVNAEVGVRFTNSFKYNTLKMLGILESDGIELQTDTLLINIYNERGYANGNGFPYTTITDSIPSLRVDSGNTYQYKIIPIPAKDHIEGISSIGLKLEN